MKISVLKIKKRRFLKRKLFRYYLKEVLLKLNFHRELPQRTSKPTLIFDSTLGEHKDIAFKYLVVPDGGGRMKIDTKNKKIEVYGKSRAFGEADKEKAIEYLKKVFKDYEIVVEEKEK